MVCSQLAKYNKYLYHNNKTQYVVSMPNTTSIYTITTNTVHSQLAKYNKYLYHITTNNMVFLQYIVSLPNTTSIYTITTKHGTIVNMPNTTSIYTITTNIVCSQHPKYNKYLYHNNKHDISQHAKYLCQQKTRYIVSLPNTTYLQNKNKHGTQLACQIQQVFIP